MRSHLISQVVLKQFADEQRQIVVHTKDSNDTEIKPIDSVAYMDINDALIRHLEDKWSNGVEDNAERAINALRNNNLVVVEKHIEAVKELIALHFIRSQVFQLVEINKQAIDGRLMQARDEVIAVYPEYKELIEQKYAESMKTVYVDVAIGIMEQFIPKIEEYISDSDIGFEIGEAPAGSEFILGDMPVITADRNHNFGIPITEANAIVMPLTPKYLVAIKKNPDTKKYKKLTATQVKNANEHQLGLMHERYYSTATFTGV